MPAAPGTAESRDFTVAVMQPYFFPYAGYYRLLASSDLFVIFDCVQFVRRGRIHRCETDMRGRLEWLTLPTAHCPRETAIKDVAFRPDARESFAESLRRLDWLAQADGPLAAELRDFLRRPAGDLVGFLHKGFKLVCGALGIETPIVRSSSLGLDPALRNEARVIAAAQAVGARCYLNAPGGRDIYDARAFAERGIDLRFLGAYGGGYRDMLKALATEPPADIRADIDKNTTIEAALP